MFRLPRFAPICCCSKITSPLKTKATFTTLSDCANAMLCDQCSTALQLLEYQMCWCGTSHTVEKAGIPLVSFTNPLAAGTYQVRRGTCLESLWGRVGHVKWRHPPLSAFFPYRAAFTEKSIFLCKHLLQCNCEFCAQNSSTSTVFSCMCVCVRSSPSVTFFSAIFFFPLYYKCEQSARILCTEFAKRQRKGGNLWKVNKNLWWSKKCSKEMSGS